MTIIGFSLKAYDTSYPDGDDTHKDSTLRQDLAQYSFSLRYIGGCCGFEPYLIRAIAEELREERKGLPYSSRFANFLSDKFNETLEQSFGPCSLTLTLYS